MCALPAWCQVCGRALEFQVTLWREWGKTGIETANIGRISLATSLSEFTHFTFVPFPVPSPWFRFRFPNSRLVSNNDTPSPD